MPTTETEIARLNINLPAPVLAEIRELAARSHRSMTDLVRDAFALAKIAYQERERGHHLTVTDAEGRVLKELVMPR